MSGGPEVFFFGSRTGGHEHALYSQRGTEISLKDLPWGYALDGGILASHYVGDQADGKFAVEFKSGWTALAFWDRSGDKRQGSNGCFLVRGKVPWAELLRMAREQWPKLVTRPGFPLDFKGEPASVRGQ